MRGAALALALVSLAHVGCACEPLPFPPSPGPRGTFDGGTPPDAFFPDAFEVLPVCTRLFDECVGAHECGGQACVMTSTRTVRVRSRGEGLDDGGLGDAGVDASVSDASVPDASVLDGSPDASVPDDAGVMEGVPDRIALVRFSQRVCSSECDMSDPAACGACGRCIDWTPLGSARIPLGAGICHLRCETDAQCPARHVCHPEGVCVRGCQPQAGYSECGLHGIDDDGDGLDEAVFYDEDAEQARCEAGHCVPPVGAPCRSDDECGGLAMCLIAEGQTSGMCAPPCGRGCADADGVCARTRAGLSYCSPPCEPGAEPSADRLGTSGHGQGCAAGFACEQGCVQGNYNPIETPNLGAPCVADQDCFSPYGAGFCAGATADTEGICSVRCAHLLEVVDDPELVCDASAGHVCDSAGCILPCGAPEECPAGLACSALRGASARTCRVMCNGPADCRAGESCRSGRCAP